MKTLVTVVVTLLVAVPLLSFAVEGIVQYDYVSLRNYTSVVKFYDHDEGVLCYVTDGSYSGGISCLRD